MTAGKKVVVEFQDFEISYVKNSKSKKAFNVTVYLNFHGTQYPLRYSDVKLWEQQLTDFKASFDEELELEINQVSHVDLFRSEITQLESVLKDLRGK